MNTFQDRLRIPWRGGAKQISLDSALPLVLQPLLAYIAAQNVWCTILVFVSMYTCLCYIYHLFQMFHPRSKFFFMWALTSVVLVLLVFEVNVVPLLEILPTENFVFVMMVVAALGCTYKVRTRASLSHVAHGDAGDELSGRAVETVCSVCRRRVPPRTYHCSICQACVVARDRHCVWFDCCIGERNQSIYMLSLLLFIASLVYGAILTLTTVCHPFFFMELVLLPDDCSDVYHDFQIALCFVGAVYCLVLAVYFLALLLHQCLLVSLGQTGQEWRLSHGGLRKCYGLWADRPYSKGLLRNWAAFLFCRKG